MKGNACLLNCTYRAGAQLVWARKKQCCCWNERCKCITWKPKSVWQGRRYSTNPEKLQLKYAFCHYFHFLRPLCYFNHWRLKLENAHFCCLHWRERQLFYARAINQKRYTRLKKTKALNLHYFCAVAGCCAIINQTACGFNVWRVAIMNVWTYC